MEVNRNQLSEVKQKILNGLDLVRKRLLESKRRDHKDIVIFKDGKVIRVKSTEL